ncbi:MAG: N-6 DNA methylase [Candidatus Heimdallarchaeota archaeon]|nr:N-6 DNA methylase [Candidatus Heimdallarchaeota archaeon]
MLIEKLNIMLKLFPFCFEMFSPAEIEEQYPFINNYLLNGDLGEDPLGNMYQEVLSKSIKQRKGIVFTPIEVIEYILHQMQFPQKEGINSPRKLIDLACGSGLFLEAAVKHIIELAQQMDLEEHEILKCIEETIHGFDVDPIAVYLTKINVLRTIISIMKLNFPENYVLELKIYQTNSLEKHSKKDSKTILELKKSQFDYVVGNPPYIESKRMDAETKAICRSNFPESVMGSFDLYNCFIDYGSQLLSPEGQLGFIIPNKFLISRYGKKLRKKFLEQKIIKQIVDLAHQKVFRPAVYPIILILNKNSSNGDQIEMIPNVSMDNLSNVNITNNRILSNRDIFVRSSNKTIFFLDDISMNIIQRIFDKSNYNLIDLIRFRWSVSFHRKGLRKMFVFRQPKGKNPLKFLGGKEYGGNRELERYAIKWGGYWIDYDREKAKGMKNNFQDLKYFTEEKIFLCQHSLRIRATLDRDSYISKDIFLLGHLKDKAESLGVNLELILATLNSKLFSFLYATMYSGTEIMGRYLHYLPMFLHDLPIIIPSNIEIKSITKLVKAILNTIDPDEKSRTDELIDENIFKIYGCNKEEIVYIEDYISLNLKK